MNTLEASPKRAEAARYQKIADELTAAAIQEEAAQLKTAQEEAVANATPPSNNTKPQNAEETQQAGGDSTGSTFMDQLLGRNGR